MGPLRALHLEALLVSSAFLHTGQHCYYQPPASQTGCLQATKGTWTGRTLDRRTVRPLVPQPGQAEPSPWSLGSILRDGGSQAHGGSGHSGGSWASGGKDKCTTTVSSRSEYSRWLDLSEYIRAWAGQDSDPSGRKGVPAGSWVLPPLCPNQAWWPQVLSLGLWRVAQPLTSPSTTASSLFASA